MDTLKGKKIMVWTFMGNTRMYNALRDYGDRISQIGLFSFKVRATGEIYESGVAISNMLTYINRYPHIKWLLTVANDGTNSIFKALRDNTNGAQDKFLSEIVRIMQKYPWCDGIDIDLEKGDGYSTHEASTAMFRNIYNTVKNYDSSKMMNICLPGMTSVNGSVGGENWCVYADLNNYCDTAFYRWFSVFGAAYMVLFFLLSGYGFRIQPVKKAVQFNFRTLLKPYYITVAMVLLTKLLLSFIRQRSFWKHGGEYIITYALGLNFEGGGTLFGIPVESISILWFLWALFEARCLFNCLSKLGNRRMTYALSFACTLIGYGMMRVSAVWPFVLHLGLLATGWVALGNLIREEHLLDKKMKIAPLAIIVLLGLNTILRSHADLIRGEMDNGAMDIIGITCLGFLLLRLSDQIMERTSDSAVCRFFGAIGMNNLWIICIHAYEKVILPHYKILEWFPDHKALQVALIFIVRMVFIVAVLWGVYQGKELLRKFRRRGRKKITIEME